jgi:Leucine-rich repeat (LRR) protein
MPQPRSVIASRSSILTFVLVPLLLAGWISGCQELGLETPSQAPPQQTETAPEIPSEPAVLDPNLMSRIESDAAAQAAPKTPDSIVAGFLVKPSNQVTDADLSELVAATPANTSIAELDLRGAALTRSGLGLLGQLPNLRSVNLLGSGTLSAEWVGLASATQIETLNLENTTINDESLTSVGALVNLKSLSLSKTHVTDVGFQHLVNLSKLESFSCADTSITGVGFEAFTKKYAGAPLREINVNNTHFGAGGFPHIDGISTLETLVAGSAGVTDVAIQEIRRAKSLKTLRLGSNSLSDKGLTFLTNLDLIENLDLGSNQLVSDFLLDKLKRQKNLKKLRVESTSCTVNGVQEFKKLLPACAVEFMGMTF